MVMFLFWSLALGIHTSHCTDTPPLTAHALRKKKDERYERDRHRERERYRERERERERENERERDRERDWVKQGGVR